MLKEDISSFMVKGPFVASPQQSLTEALECMAECGVRHLPVVEDDDLVGIVSERDLKAASALQEGKKLFVSDVMKTDVFVVSRFTPLSEVAYEMAERKVGSAIVVDANSRLLGIFTTTDALRVLATLTTDENVDAYLEPWESFAQFDLKP